MENGEIIIPVVAVNTPVAELGSRIAHKCLGPCEYELTRSVVTVKVTALETGHMPVAMGENN